MHETYIVALVFSCVHVCCIVFQHSGQEFHEDLYPDTVGTSPAMSAEEWWQGGNKQVKHLHSHHVNQVFTMYTRLKQFVLRWRKSASTQTNSPN